MKIYVIMQKTTEYNDEYDAIQEEGARIYKAFRNPPTQEQIDAAKWNAIEGKIPSYDDSGWPDDMAYVEEIEVGEDQIIQPDEVPITSKRKNTDTYAEAQARTAAARVGAAAMTKDAIHASVGVIFDQYPDLESFSWTQYTPYFNDGDECVFSVNHPKVILKGFNDKGRASEELPVVLYYRVGKSDKVYVIDNDYHSSSVKFSFGKRGFPLINGVKLKSENWKERDNLEKRLTAEKKAEGYGEPLQDIKDLLNSIAPDDMKSVFGDHVQVTATRDGITTEPYDHD